MYSMAKHLSTSTASSSPMEPSLLPFEAAELERFLNLYFAGEFVDGPQVHPGMLFIEGWENHEGPWAMLLRERTRRGLESGVNRYRQETSPSASSIYETDLGQLCHDHRLPEEVTTTVGELSFVRNPQPYAQHVSTSYATFLYRDSQQQVEAAGHLK